MEKDKTYKKSKLKARNKKEKQKKGYAERITLYTLIATILVPLIPLCFNWVNNYTGNNIIISGFLVKEEESNNNSDETPMQWLYNDKPTTIFFKTNTPKITGEIHYDSEKSIKIKKICICAEKKGEIDVNKVTHISSGVDLPYTGITPKVFLNATLSSSVNECNWIRYTNDNNEPYELEQNSEFTLTKNEPDLDFEIDVIELPIDSGLYKLTLLCEYMENGKNLTGKAGLGIMYYIDYPEGELLKLLPT